MSANQTLVYLNPASGKGRAESVLHEYQDVLRTRFDAFEVLRTPEALESAAIGNNPLNVIIIGGDGTVHTAVNTLMKRQISSPITLGILSTGTGCDFSRSLGKSTSGEAELNRIVQGRANLLDIGECTFAEGDVHYYVNSASIGLGGYACGQVKKWQRRYLPPMLAYLVPGAKALFTYSGAQMNVLADHRPVFEGHGLGVMVYNGRFSGGGMLWAGSANIGDGQLDMLVKKPLPKTLIPTAVAKLMSGQIDKLANITTYKVRTAFVASTDSQPLPIELDGEYFESASFNFKVLPARMNVFTEA